jgi:hypothetical protein
MRYVMVWYGYGMGMGMGMVWVYINTIYCRSIDHSFSQRRRRTYAYTTLYTTRTPTELNNLSR